VSIRFIAADVVAGGLRALIINDYHMEPTHVLETYKLKFGDADWGIGFGVTSHADTFMNKATPCANWFKSTTPYNMRWIGVSVGFFGSVSIGYMRYDIDGRQWRGDIFNLGINPGFGVSLWSRLNGTMADGEIDVGTWTPE
jgi:hypothetical protein